MQVNSSSPLTPQNNEVSPVLGVSLHKLQDGGDTPQIGDGMQMELSDFCNSLHYYLKMLNSAATA